MKKSWVVLTAALVVVSPALAWAQTGYVTGRSGVTFGTATAPVAGVEVGARVGSLVKVYGSFDWHQNIVQQDLAEAVDFFGTMVGVDMSVAMPSYTFFGGAKVQAPRGAVRPYGLGGIGMGRVKGRVEVNGSNVSDLLGLDDELSFTKPVFEVGGGVVIPVARVVFVDVGYRFRKFLDAESVNVSGLYAGVGFSF